MKSYSTLLECFGRIRSELHSIQSILEEVVEVGEFFWLEKRFKLRGTFKISHDKNVINDKVCREGIHKKIFGSIAHNSNLNNFNGHASPWITTPSEFQLRQTIIFTCDHFLLQFPSFNATTTLLSLYLISLSFLSTAFLSDFSSSLSHGSSFLRFYQPPRFSISPLFKQLLF